MIVGGAVEGGLPVVVLVVDDDHLRGAVRPLLLAVVLLLRMRRVELGCAAPPVLLLVEGDLDGLAVGGRSSVVLVVLLRLLIILVLLALPVPHAVLVLDRGKKGSFNTRHPGSGDRFGEYLLVYCVNLPCARETQIISKHKIHQTCHRGLEVYF